MGMTVDYDSATRMATMAKDGIVAVHVIGTYGITVNGVTTEFDTESTVAEGSTLVPVRMLADAINAEINWESDTRTVKITT